MSATAYDLVILGGGTGGYTAAIRAAQLGLKTAIVEKEKVGGTCLHKGCIPTKALLRSADVYRTVQQADTFGILLDNPSLQLDLIQKRKNSIIHTLHTGVQSLLKKGKIDVYEGTGRILGPSIFSPMSGSISVELHDGSNITLTPKHVIVATGSRPKELAGLKTDGEFVLTSNEALDIQELPSSVLIIGGGVIGIEWASMLADFGSAVTVAEYGDRILPQEDEDISREMARLLGQKGVKIMTSSQVDPASLLIQGGMVQINDQNGHVFSAEKVLVAVGRAANIEQIGLENTEAVVKNGVVQVNEQMQTKEPHIYAIGDVIGGLQLAHVAAHEGLAAVAHIAGQAVEPVDYQSVAKCIYSNPEAASVGWTEQEAKAKGIKVKIGRFPFQAIGKALVYGETNGFVKVIADAETDDVIGVHVIGPQATELIAEAALAKFLNASGWELGAVIHPHPTLSEAFGEAALMMDGKAIHL